MEERRTEMKITHPLLFFQRPGQPTRKRSNLQILFVISAFQPRIPIGKIKCLSYNSTRGYSIGCLAVLKKENLGLLLKREIFIASITMASVIVSISLFVVALSTDQTNAIYLFDLVVTGIWFMIFVTG